MSEISVIIPVRNGAATIGPLLDSLSAQGMAPLEVICVDDASSDGTGELLRGRPGIRIVTHARRRGAGAARNSGARVARGDLLLFLDADTRLADGDLLQTSARLMQEHPEVAALSGAYLDENPSTGTFGRYLDAFEAEARPQAGWVEVQSSLTGAVCVVRRTAFERLGGFDESPRAALEDADLGARLCRAGYRVAFSTALRVEHRQPGGLAYCRELVPRTRHYLHMLRRYGAFNEVMGGGGEGFARLLVLLLAAALLLAPLAPPAGVAIGAGSLLGLAVVRRQLWRQLWRNGGMSLLAAGAGFYVATTLPMVVGGLLGLFDALADLGRRLRAEAAAVTAYLRSLASRDAPGYLILFLTHRCNAFCGHCFDDPQRQTIGAADELDLEQLGRLAQGAGAVGHLSLTGGEPLLRNDLPQIVEQFYRAGVRSFSLSTNGSLPERIASLLPDALQRAPGARFIVTLSYDGLGETHDRLRGVPGLFDKLERSYWHLDRLRGWYPQLHLHACLTLFADNRETADETIGYLERRHFDQIELNLMRGTPASPDCMPADAADYAGLRRRVQRVEAGGRFGLASLFRRLDRMMFDIIARPEDPWPCGSCVAGGKLAVILANGQVLPCEMLRDVQPGRAAEFNDFVIGKVDEQGGDLRGLLRSPEAQRMRRMIRETGCSCSFECAIFATMVYRPWRLPGALLRPARE